MIAVLVEMCAYKKYQRRKKDHSWPYHLADFPSKIVCVTPETDFQRGSIK